MTYLTTGAAGFKDFRKLTPLPIGAVAWDEGFWGDRFELCRRAILPSMRQALDEPENGAVFSNFDVAAGRQAGEHKGTMWSDGDCYKWMEAMAHVYGITQDAAILSALDERIDVIAQAQEDDGYLSAPMQLRDDKERWTNLHDHELYNMGHLLTAAAVHHRATGQGHFLRIAVKLADYLDEVFQPRPPELAHFGFNPSHIMGLIDLFRVTDNPKYLALAKIFVDMRGSQPGGKDLNQTGVPLRDETQAVGHAVTAGYLYCGAADVYAECGDGDLLRALERIWENVVSSRMYITGGTAALHHGASMRPEFGGQRVGGPVHEAYGFDYQLPNASAYNETCANIAQAMWGWRMLNLSGDARYADIIELVLYNSMLSSMSLDGLAFCYTNPLRWHGHDHVLLSQDSYQRWTISRCYCCPTNTARTIALLHHWVYSQSDEGFWIHLYGSSSLHTTLADGAAFGLRQETDYPWDQRVKITIEEAPPRQVALMLRIPGWTDEATVKVNGELLPLALQPKTYAEVKRVWRPGDALELDLPMKIRMIKAHPKAEEIRNHIAVMRGPIVYCLEAVDLPSDVAILEVFAPAGMQLTPRLEKEWSGGLITLHGQARRVYEEGQADSLYTEMGNEREESIDITLIPYYAWNNRGVSEMTVWLPRGH